MFVIGQFDTNAQPYFKIIIVDLRAVLLKRAGVAECTNGLLKN